MITLLAGGATKHIELRIFKSVYAKDRNEAIQYVRAWLSKDDPYTTITELSCADDTRIMDFDSFVM